MTATDGGGGIKVFYLFIYIKLAYNLHTEEMLSG